MPRGWREPAEIAAEIDRIRSLRLDAPRRQGGGCSAALDQVVDVSKDDL
jgi:hypothetical protein